MKKLIKKAMVLVFILVFTQSLTTEGPTKAMQARDGEIKLEVFKHILRNRTTGVLQRNVWNKIFVTDPQTGRQIFQEVYIWAYLPNYLPEIMTEAQINGITVRPFGSVKAGSYRNNGYDVNGMKQALKPDYIPILVNFNYFCDADGVAIAKTNCANEQDWLQPYTPPVTRIDPYVPPAPKGEFIYVPCLGKEIEMEPRNPATGHQASKNGTYVLRNTGVWYYATGVPGEFKKLTCDPVQASSGSVNNNYYSNNYYNNTYSSPNTMNALYPQQQVQQQCCPQERNRSYVGIGIALSFVSALAPMIQQRQTYYDPYQPSQPVVQWSGTSSNSGSYYNNYGTSTGNSSNGGSGGYSTGNSSNSGGGNAGEWTIISRD